MATLQRDGRTTIQKLADTVGLSARPCLERVRRLEAAKTITGYQAAVPAGGPVTVPDEAHSAQPGTAAWAGFGTGPGTPA